MPHKKKRPLTAVENLAYKKLAQAAQDLLEAQSDGDEEYERNSELSHGRLVPNRTERPC